MTKGQYEDNFDCLFPDYCMMSRWLYNIAKRVPIFWAELQSLYLHKKIFTLNVIIFQVIHLSNYSTIYHNHVDQDLQFVWVFHIISYIKSQWYELYNIPHYVMNEFVLKKTLWKYFTANQPFLSAKKICSRLDKTIITRRNIILFIGQYFDHRVNASKSLSNTRKYLIT